MKLSAVFALALAGLVLLLSPVSAVVYVKQDSPGPAFDGDSWNTAYHAIQAGLDNAAATGEEVWVARGTYVEQITLKAGIALKGGYSGTADTRDVHAYPTVVDTGNKSYATSTVTAGNSGSIDGFIIRGGYNCVKCTAGSPVVTNNYIGDSRIATYGGGIQGPLDAIYCSTGSSPIIRNNRIFNRDGWGVRCDSSSSPVIDSNTIIGTLNGGVYCYMNSDPAITNNIIAGCANGISTYYAGSVRIANNTITSNWAQGIMIDHTVSPSYISNNIIAFNSIGINFYASSNATLSHNNLYGNRIANYSGASVLHPNDISSEPQFVSAEFGNFHILPTSLCRNAGDPSATGVPSTDMDGQARSEGANIDIGADESYGENYPSPYVARIVYVDASATAGGNGTTWAAAYNTLQAAEEDVSLKGGAEVWVAKGSYAGPIGVMPFVRLCGGFASGDLRSDRNLSKAASIRYDFNDAPLATVVGPATVDGITFRGYTGIVGYGFGVISNNRIRNATTGITSYGNSRLTICGNKIYACQTGVTCNGTVTTNGPSESSIIANNLIFSNRMGLYFTGPGGSTLCVRSSVCNNTLLYNSTAITIGSNSAPSISNNIVMSNSSGIYKAGSTTVLSHNDVYANGVDYESSSAPHTSDISQDPLFACPNFGDFHIRSASPCRNAGDNSAPDLPQSDIDGQQRKEGIAVDIGADESYGEVYPSPYQPRVVYVSGSAADGGDGTSWATAYKTIQAGVDDTLTKGGAEIWVAQGMYFEHISLPMFASMLGGFASGDGRAQRDPAAKTTVIDGGQGGTSLVTLSMDRATTADGFTIRSKDYTVEVTSTLSAASPSATLMHNIITGSNHTAVTCNASAVVSCNAVVENTGGAGIYCSTNSTKCNVVNNIIANNGRGIGVESIEAPEIANNTIVANGTGMSIQPQTFQYDPARANLRNNIIAFNATGVFNSYSNSYPTLAYNNVYGNTTNYGTYVPAHPTDISADPLFANRASGDYHLLPGSRCIDVGDPTNVQQEDFDGNIRPKDGDGNGTARVDIGCYECPTNYVSLRGAKNLDNGMKVGIGLCVSTAVFPDRFYVESLDRLCGFAVIGACSGTGRYMTVEGTISTDNGEKVITPSSIVQGVSTSVPKPFFLNTSALGGSSLGAQEAIKDGLGLNNIGLLIKTAGRISNSGTGELLLDGVEVSWPFPEAMPSDGSFVEMLAISSCTRSSGEIVRMLRPLSAGAVKTIGEIRQ